MTSVYYLNEELNEIIESFYTRVKHPYLQKYIDKPVIDRDQASLLFLLLKHKGAEPSYISQCIITTILVQAALDTHEKVGVNQYLSDSMNKKRQLTVLAGDYYSSLYYYFLSKVNDVALIRVLAQSIQEINESKMNVYKMEDNDDIPSLSDVITVDASLLRNIANSLNLSDWKKIIEDFFFFKRLLKERLMWIDGKVAGNIANIFIKEKTGQRIVGQEDYILKQFDRHIEMTKDRLINITHNWTSLRGFIHTRIQDLLNENRYDEQYVAEEG
ncbi:heptaprenyl diphosphate synthase component 1 [Evansella tamaricis]|uniref:Heptaprenyl diphosphate synthase component 1 n=1 Tax=Evansella tamaricis TaxID=2069301 RepID=A0ABS6JDV3_9BACI|nr:heptaprenyl diphosphate synthase component 1 [Evansella tamaricis]MBU9711831.1 heptaprenyl diphosphate synthase component 1 [Evansella tamaricis]